MKEILVDAPLFIHYPDPSAPKLLFVDSSDILLGAVLFDVVFPPITLLEHECEFDIESMRQNNRVIQPILDEIDLPAFPISITSRPDSSFFESLSYLTKQLLIENAPENHKLLRQAVLYHLKQSILSLIACRRGMTGPSFSKLFNQRTPDWTIKTS